jgi:uncharacterized protein YegL
MAIDNYMSNHDEEDFVENSNPKIPVCLVLDTSGSMGQNPLEINGKIVKPIDALTEGIKAFFEAIRQDPRTRSSCEVCIVAFNDEARKIQDFIPIHRQSDISVPDTGGGGDMGLGVTTALDLLAARKAKYQKYGSRYFQPWLFVFSDGRPTNGNAHAKVWKQHLDEAIAKTTALEEKDKLNIVPIYCGKNSQIGQKDWLEDLTKKNQVKSVTNMNFTETFNFLAQSVSRFGGVTGQQYMAGISKERQVEESAPNAETGKPEEPPLKTSGADTNIDDLLSDLLKDN